MKEKAALFFLFFFREKYKDFNVASFVFCEAVIWMQKLLNLSLGSAHRRVTK